MRAILQSVGTAAGRFVRRQRYRMPSGVVSTRNGMDYDRRPPAEWQALLDAECPVTRNSSRLVLAWDAGDSWEGGPFPQPRGLHRWVILQVTPWHLLDHRDAHIKEILAGPPVRTGARLEYVRAVVDGKLQMRPRVRGPYASQGVDRLEHSVFRRLVNEEGYWGRPVRFWNVQGPDGGQPFRISWAEEELWKQQGRTHAALGDLPYAEVDERVVHAIRRYDLWRYANDLGDPQTFAATATIKRLQSQELEAHKLTWRAWENFAEKTGDEMAFMMRKDGVHRMRWDRPGEKVAPVDLDELRDAHINATTVDVTA